MRFTRGYYDTHPERSGKPERKGLGMAAFWAFVMFLGILCAIFQSMETSDWILFGIIECVCGIIVIFSLIGYFKRLFD